MILGRRLALRVLGQQKVTELTRKVWEERKGGVITLDEDTYFLYIDSATGYLIVKNSSRPLDPPTVLHPYNQRIKSSNTFWWMLGVFLADPTVGRRRGQRTMMGYCVSPELEGG